MSPSLLYCTYSFMEDLRLFSFWHSVNIIWRIEKKWLKDENRNILALLSRPYYILMTYLKIN